MSWFRSGLLRGVRPIRVRLGRRTLASCACPTIPLGPPINYHQINILFLSPWFPDRVHPQDGNFVRRYARMVAEKHTVTVVHVAPDPSLAGSEPEVVRSEEPYGQVISVYYAGGGARVQRLLNRSRAWQRAFHCCPEQLDLIHAHVLIDGGIMARRLARQRGIPYLISCHSSRYLEKEGRSRLLLDYALARRAARGAAALLPVSTALAAGLQRAGMRGHYQVVPNVIDDHFFRPPPHLSAAPGFRLFHLSDGSRQKNLDLLITAFLSARSRLPTLQLTLAGNMQPATVSALLPAGGAAAAGVTFIGPLQRAEVVHALGDHDLFVLSSTVETQGIVLGEALLCGLPVVTTDCGGPTDLHLTEQDGTLVPVGAASSFAEAILGWAARGRPSLAERQARHQRYARHFSRAKLQGCLEDIYTTAVTPQKSPR